MNELDAMGNSMLQWIVSAVGRSHLQQVQVELDSTTDSANVTLTLAHDTLEEQARAIDAMLELRKMYLGELALEYSFQPRLAEQQVTDAEAFSLAVL